MTVPDELLVPAFQEVPDAFMAILERQATAWGGRELDPLIDALARAGATGLTERVRSTWNH